jgi:nitronate monooxygenase
MQHVGLAMTPWLAKLRLPVIVAPMFLVSGPDLVVAAARAGLIGSFPAPNARTVADLEAWLADIVGALGPVGLPWAVNFITHRTYDRFDAELALVRRYRPPLVITALGNPARVADSVHAYGGLVFADVNTPLMADKAVRAGADGLVLVCAGAGGHTGRLSPFAFVHEVRQFWRGPIVVAGAVSSARGIHAAQMLGADMVYMGTRFIAATESLASQEYRSMVVRARAEDIVETAAVTGVSGNFMRESLIAAGLDPAAPASRGVDFSGQINDEAKAWKHIWSAGQGAASVDRIAPVADIVTELEAEYRALDARTAPMSAAGVAV